MILFKQWWDRDWGFKQSSSGSSLFPAIPVPPLKRGENMSIKKKFEAKITLTWTEDPESIEDKWDDRLITSEIKTWLEDLDFKVEVKVNDSH